MTIIGTNPAEKEESGQRKRESVSGSAETSEVSSRSALSISKRLRRQITGVISALASLTKSGRMSRISFDQDQLSELEDSREIVSLSLDAFTDGLLCVGGMAESLKGRAEGSEKNPYQMVVEIINHTIQKIFDHPFFHEAGIGAKDTIMVEEAENAIMVHVRGKQGYQKISCSELFTIPEHLKPGLDEVVTMWSHFFGKEYDISCFYELEVFERLDQLKERAKPLNRLFGGIIRAFDDAVDVARSRYAETLESFEDTRIEQEPPKNEELTTAELPAKKTHGVSQPFFPPRPLKQVYDEIQPTEQKLREMDEQFEGIVEELMKEVTGIFAGEQFSPTPFHQIADRLPEATTPDQKRLDQVYRELVPGSTLNLLNPRAFILALLRKWAEKKAEKGEWNPEEGRKKSLRQILVEISPGELFLQQLGELVTKEKKSESSDEDADDIKQQFGRLSELATSALFPKTSTPENIVTTEILCHEHLIRPDKPFSFHQRVANSPVLQGDAPSTEDKLCRLAIGLVEILQGKRGALPGGISGVFFLATGHFHEGKRWIKNTTEEKPMMEDRCHWLQGVFEKYLQEKSFQLFGKAFFGFLQAKTKQEWDGLPGGMSMYRLVQHQAKIMEWDEEDVENFRNAYDAQFSGLEQKVEELLGGENAPEKIEKIAWALHAYWHKSLQSLLPITYGMLRADTRLRGQLASVGSIRSFELPGLDGPQVIPFLIKSEKAGKIVLPSVGKDGVNPYFLTINKKQRRIGSA